MIIQIGLCGVGLGVAAYGIFTGMKVASARSTKEFDFGELGKMKLIGIGTDNCIGFADNVPICALGEFGDKIAKCVSPSIVDAVDLIIGFPTV